MIKTKNRQLASNTIRQQVRFIKAIDQDWTYKNIAEAINLNTHSFYNWLSGSYELS